MQSPPTLTLFILTLDVSQPPNLITVILVVDALLQILLDTVLEALFPNLSPIQELRLTLPVNRVTEIVH